MQLGKYGIWTSYRAIGEENAGHAATLVEDLGYGTFWLGGSPQLPAVRPLLAATSTLTIATGIVNVWQYEPADLAAEFHQLDQEFPGRLLLGIGIGHPEATSVYEKPLQKMRHFFDGLAQAPQPVPRESMIAAALGPKMLELSFARSLGTHPYFVPPSHTRFAREHLGPQAVIAPELAVVLDGDSDRARASAHRYAELYLNLTNYTSNLLRLEYTEDDLNNGGSERLIDTVVPQSGDPAALAAKVQEHLDAGADHVCLQTVGATGVPEREWTALASALIT